jgi:peroxiredoxin
MRHGQKQRTGTPLLAALVALVFWVPTQAGAVNPGDVVADATATTLDGRSVSLSQLAAAHRAVALIFLSVSCPYSNAYNESLHAMSGSYADRGVAFVGVYPNASENNDEIRAHAARYGHTFPIVRDGHLDLTRSFGAKRTPEVFLLDSSRVLRYRGRIQTKFGSPDLANAIEAVLAGRPVKQSQTKAFGCAIEGR